MKDFEKTTLGTSSLYFVDCMEFMAGLKDNHYDVGIVDPQWGRKQHGGTSRSTWVEQANGGKVFVVDGGYKRKQWDDEPVGSLYFKELRRVTKHQIIFGCNYFNEYFGSGRIIWDKCNEGSDQSNCEIAYNSMTSRVDLFRFMWRGMMQGSGVINGHVQNGNKKLNEMRIHPCQKPVALYDWILNKYISPGMTIFDSHHGSGSLSISSNKLGYKIDACENDRDYYDGSVKRINNEIRQVDCFSEQSVIKARCSK
jgi:site-specific DNA-methyltransferase (adenine-specific)